ncbi:MAG: hypothetical protein RDV41_04710 [Planctomycetota bacterium]|nr:hypothetical protein [Planctomycetota bacterium]
MRRMIAAFFVFGLAALACGCFETKEELFINPDGSGKVVIESVYQPMDFSGGSDPQAAMRKSVKEIIEKSKGIDTWSNVSFQLNPDKKVCFKGTAYFKDVSTVKIENAAALEIAMQKNSDGKLVFEMRGDQKGSGEPGALTEEQIKNKISEEKTKYQQSRPMMVGMLGTLRSDAVLHLPGTVEQSTNFKKNPDGSLTVSLQGMKVIEAMDAIMNDEAALRAMIESGNDVTEIGPGSDPVFMEKMFGERAPVRAVVGGTLTPLFDYEGEAAQARAGMEEMMTKLGITVAKPVPLAGRAEFKSLTIGGVRIVRIDDGERGIRPFYESKGCTLALVGELPGAVLKVTEGKLEKAIASTGANLLPEDEWSRTISMCTLSADKTAVVFDVRLQLPDQDVPGLKEVSGTLEYVIEKGAKQVDIGVEEFKTGAPGKELGASIVSVKDSEWQAGTQVLSLQLAIAQEAIKAVHIYDTGGKELTTNSQGYMSSNETTTVDYSMEGKFPAKGRIVVEVYDTEKYAIPFKIENVTLTGAPLK